MWLGAFFVWNWCLNSCKFMRTVPDMSQLPVVAFFFFLCMFCARWVFLRILPAPALLLMPDMSTGDLFKSLISDNFIDQWNIEGQFDRIFSYIIKKKSLKMLNDRKIMKLVCFLRRRQFPKVLLICQFVFTSVVNVLVHLPIKTVLVNHMYVQI